jgi:serine/threonine-protein kinase
VHAAGLLHRDVKPGNVYLNEVGDAQLGDMGMAVHWDSQGRTPPDGTIITVAPEALIDDSPYCSTQSDIYSLSATVYFLLSGEYPVDHRLSKLQIKEHVTAGRIRSLRDLAPHVPQGIATVVMRGLALTPNSRISSALEFANKLASGKRHRRNWRRVKAHDGHMHCLRGESAGNSKAVNVCTAPAGDTFNIITTFDSGRQIRQGECLAVSSKALMKTIRDLTTNL